MHTACDIGILFADVAGSTALYERLGDAAALSVIEGALDTAAAEVSRHGGRVVKLLGDELMAAFPDAVAAMAAAVAIRAATDARAADAGDPCAAPAARLRIGVHFGPAIAEGGDFFGDTVNVAARLVALARADQILTSGELLDRLPPAQRATATEFGLITVRGRDAPLRVAQVPVADALQQSTVVRFARPAANGAALTFVIAGRVWPVPPDLRDITCGRDPGNDIVLAGPLVSRRHATIERRRDKVFLVDHSTNGTVVIQGDEPPVTLLREEFGLARAGRILFGRADDPAAETVTFRIG
jgi:class 3 adenylate cyclase